MNEANQVKSKTQRLLLLAARVLMLVAIAAGVGWTLNRIGSNLEGDGQPAGFARGMIQGALMPMALPNLLVGQDVNIYSTNNTGIRYKLGYSSGVNICGAVFFSFMFWRLKRLRKTMREWADP